MLIESIKNVNFGKKIIFPWFCDKDLSSVNLLSKTHDFVKKYKWRVGGWVGGRVGWGATTHRRVFCSDFLECCFLWECLDCFGKCLVSLRNV